MSVDKLVHVSVLQKEVLTELITESTRTVFDGTLGLGGHAELILEAFPQIDCYIGTDLDRQHLVFARKRLAKWDKKLITFHQNFSTITEIIKEVNPKRPMAILLDLGVCSNQLDDAEKGFSFRKDGPLNMSFGEGHSKDCERLLNEASLESLRKVLREYGEEPEAHRLSKKIIESRTHKPIKTTGDLREIIEKNTNGKALKKTLMRVFQALRIATNDELGHLEKAMEGAVSVMESGDRLGIMSFHSLEDRIVKRFFKKQSQPITKETTFSLHTEVAPAQFRLRTKRPLCPSKQEQQANPRSRSVKFRILEKI